MSESYALDRQLLFVNEYTHSCQYEFEKMKESAHSKFNMDVFITDTSKVEDINCYFYAIGITYLPNRSLQRIGAISGKKAMSLCYTMADDLSELFKADMETLELNVTEVKTGLNPTKYGLISQIEGMHLGSNQYIVLLYKPSWPLNLPRFPLCSIWQRKWIYPKKKMATSKQTWYKIFLVKWWLYP